MKLFLILKHQNDERFFLVFSNARKFYVISANKLLKFFHTFRPAIMIYAHILKYV